MKKNVIKSLLFTGLFGLVFFAGIQFDSFRKVRLNSHLSYDLISSSDSLTLPTLYVRFDSTALKAIEKNKELAIKYGRGHRTHPENPGYSKVFLEKDSLSAKVKLSGGVSSHFINYENKTSLKFKIEDGDFLGMTKFSITNPNTNSNLDEWIYHQLNKDLGSNYLFVDFIQLVSNNEPRGIYSIEEHIGPSVLIRNNLPEGPVFRLDCDFVWQQNQGTHVIPDHQDIFHRSELKPYMKKSLKSSPSLALEFEKAKMLFNKFINGELRTCQVFDVKKFAKHFAIVDLMGNPHGIGLWNLKFYFNPNTQKIEPIPFDQGKIKVKDNIFYPARTIYGESYEILEKLPLKTEMTFPETFFSDINFQKAYFQELKKITEDKYLESFFQRLEKNIQQKTSILRKDPNYRNYSFDKSRKILVDNAKYIQQHVRPTMRIHAIQIESDQIFIKNPHNFPIELKRISVNGKTIWTSSKTILVQAHQKNKSTPTKTITLDNKPSGNLFIHYSIIGDSTTLKTKIKRKLFTTSYVTGSPTHLNPPLLINSSIVCGPGKTLEFPKNAKITFTQKGKIYCEGKIIFNGCQIQGNGKDIIEVNNKGEIHGSRSKFFNGRIIINGNLTNQCSFYECSFFDLNSDLIQINCSNVFLHSCNFTSLYGNGINVTDSDIHLLKPEFRNLKNGLILTNSVASINGGRFSEIQSNALTGTNSLITTEETSFIESKSALNGSNSVFRNYNCFIRKGTLKYDKLVNCVVEKNRFKHVEWTF